MKHNVLTLQKKHLTRKSYQSRFLRSTIDTEITHSYYEFLIDGKPLQLLLDPEIDPALLENWKGNISSYTTLVSPQWRWKNHLALLGKRKGELLNERVGIYFCPDCFDISDGIESLLVDKDNETIRWGSFGWTDSELDYEPIESVGAINFNEKTLIRTLGEAAFSLDRQGLQAVLNKIDFLGVADEHVGVCNEYDCMISDILAILHENGTVEQLEIYLEKDLNEHFDVTFDKKKITKYATLIMKWWNTWPNS